MPLNFSLANLVPSFIFGVIGLYVFRKGKQDAEIMVVLIGIVMMAYGYFVSNAVWNWVVGLGLCYFAYREIA